MMKKGLVMEGGAHARNVHPPESSRDDGASDNI